MLANKVGHIAPENVAFGAALLSAIPANLKEETRDSLGAWALVCVLLLDDDAAVRQKQMKALRKNKGTGAGIAAAASRFGRTCPTADIPPAVPGAGGTDATIDASRQHNQRIRQTNPS